MLCVVKLNTHNICQKPTRKQDFVQTKLKLHYFKTFLLTMKKWIFCTKATYLKILKAKDQLQLGSEAMIHHLAIFKKLDWSMRGSSFKQIKLSRSLENTENCTYGFVLLASVKSSCSNCLREKSQLFWSHCRQFSFSTSQRVKRTICVQKVILIKNRNFHSVLENKTM